MPSGSSFSVENTWNSVSLEERLELINRAHASGLVAGLTTILVVGTIAYGFDQFWLLYAGLGASFFISPLFTSYCWRKFKPELILAYLAVRTVARRYAYAYNLGDLETILIFRGTLRSTFTNKEEEALHKEKQITQGSQDDASKEKPVWISLMRGGFVVLSERNGGAKLEYAVSITPEVRCEKRELEDDPSRFEIAVTTGGPLRGRVLVFRSRYPAALYVFEKKLVRLIKEVMLTQEKLRTLRDNLFENKERVSAPGEGGRMSA